jgi:hypothetical protein
VLGIELIEPSVEPCHAVATVELICHRSLRKRGDVQARSASLLIQVIWKTYVATGHTQRVHTQP